MYTKRSTSNKNKRIGSRAQVMHGTAKQTGGGLKKKDLKYNKHGKIVSKKMSTMAKKEKRLQKAGYKTEKGVFQLFQKQNGGNNTVNISLGELQDYNTTNSEKKPETFVDFLKTKEGVSFESARTTTLINLNINEEYTIPYKFQYNKYEGDRISYEVIYEYKGLTISGVSSINKVKPDFGTNNIREHKKWLGTFGTKLKSTQSICNAFSISSDDLQNEITCRIGTNGMIYVGRITLFLNGCIGTNIVKFEDSSAAPCLADNTFSNNRSGNFIELRPLRILHEKGSIYEKLIVGELKKKMTKCM